MKRLALVASGLALFAATSIAAQSSSTEGVESTAAATLRLAEAAVVEELEDLRDSDRRATALGELAMLYHAQDRLDDAIRHYQAALREQPAQRWHYLLGVALADRGDVDAAIAQYQRAAASGDYPLVFYRLGQALLVKGDHKAAQQALQQAQTALPDSAVVLTALADAASAGGDWKQAAAFLEQAAKLEPNAGRIAYRLAMALRQVGDLDAAARWLERRNSVAPAIEDPLLLDVAAKSLSVKFFLDAGDRAWQRGERTEALAAYRNATKLAPNNVKAALALAQALGADGNTDAALMEVRRALTVDSASPRGWYLLAHLLRNSEDVGEALQAAERSLELSEDRTARTLLAALWMRARKFDSAAAAYRELASHYPDAAYYRYWLGIAELGRGNCSNARQELASAVRQQANWGQAHIALVRADSICGDAETREDARRRAVGLLAATESIDTRLTLAFAELAVGNQEQARALAETHRSHADATLLLDALAHDTTPAKPFARGSNWWLPPELR